MAKTRVPAAVAGPPFSVTSDRHEPHVLYLEGHLAASGAADLDVIATEALAQASSGLILDVAALVSVDAAGIACFNRLGAAARLRRSSVVIRTPGTHLGAELGAGSLDDGVRTEVTEPVPTRAAAAPKATPPSPPPGPDAGVARRSGRGFIASFGEGRTCAADGCTTRLSQYNGGNLCGLHDQHRLGPPSGF